MAGHWNRNNWRKNAYCQLFTPLGFNHSRSHFYRLWIDWSECIWCTYRIGRIWIAVCACQSGKYYWRCFSYRLHHRFAGTQFRFRKKLPPIIQVGGLFLYTHAGCGYSANYSIAGYSGNAGRLVWLIPTLHRTATHEKNARRQKNKLFCSQPDSCNTRFCSPFSNSIFPFHHIRNSLLIFWIDSVS